MFDAKLPAITVLNASNNNRNIQFPGEANLNYSNVRDAAQIVIPTTVILNQFSIEGTVCMYEYNYVVAITVYNNIRK